MVSHKTKKEAVTRIKELGYSVLFEQNDGRLYYRKPHAKFRAWPEDYVTLRRLSNGWYVSIVFRWESQAC